MSDDGSREIDVAAKNVLDEHDSYESLEPTIQYHSCWKKKHIIRILNKRGWCPVKGDGPIQGGICYVQKVSGCKCGSNWKLLPKLHVDCIGGKVSLAKLLARDGLTGVAPRTFSNFASFRKALTEGNVSTGKWYVKVSHLNGRRGVICFNSPAEAEKHCEAVEKDKPSWYRYVIQEQVPNLYLFQGKKMLLRLWGLVTVAGGEDNIWFHISKRLRANIMNSSYENDSTERDADVEHCTKNVFDNTSDWEHYERVWPRCAEVAASVVQSMIRLWTKRGLPPMLNDGQGFFNHLAFDFIPAVTPNGIHPYLIEVNVDPSFRNPCPETKYVFI